MYDCVVLVNSRGLVESLTSVTQYLNRYDSKVSNKLEFNSEEQLNDNLITIQVCTCISYIQVCMTHTAVLYYYTDWYSTFSGGFIFRHLK